MEYVDAAEDIGIRKRSLTRFVPAPRETGKLATAEQTRAALDRCYAILGVNREHREALKRQQVA